MKNHTSRRDETPATSVTRAIRLEMWLRFNLVFVRAQAGVPVPLEALFELGEAVEKLLVLDGARRESGLQFVHDFCGGFAEEGFVG
jgi:hypothetical protein